MIRQGNAFCLQNLGACCGCLELFVDSPVSYPLHLLLSWAHMVGSPLCMPGLSWETEAYMAQWKPLTRAVLPSISGRVSPTSASFFFFFFNRRTGGLLCHRRARKLWITKTTTLWDAVEVNIRGRLWVGTPSFLSSPLPAENYTLGPWETQSTFQSPTSLQEHKISWTFLVPQSCRPPDTSSGFHLVLSY